MDDWIKQNTEATANDHMLRKIISCLTVKTFTADSLDWSVDVDVAKTDDIFQLLLDYPPA